MVYAVDNGWEAKIEQVTDDEPEQKHLEGIFAGSETRSDETCTRSLHAFSNA